MSYPLEPIDLLVDVSKVLYNERIVEQRNRIKELEDEVNKLKAIKTWRIFDDDNIYFKCPIESILDKYTEIKRNACYYQDKGYTYSLEEKNHVQENYIILLLRTKQVIELNVKKLNKNDSYL